MLSLPRLRPTGSVSCFLFPLQASLHPEEEDHRGDVSDRQPLWPRHRVEPLRPNPEGQTLRDAM